MSTAIVLAGFLGGLALSAVKRSLGAKDWGTNPPARDKPYRPPTVLPKSTPKHKQLTMGRNVRYPRDRGAKLPPIGV